MTGPQRGAAPADGYLGQNEAIRVVIAGAKGSTPREAGAEMMVSAGSVAGSIGGGALEYMAIDRARQMLREGEARAEMDVPLGPEIGQCCGGRVRLVLDRAPASAPPPRPEVLIFGAGHVGRALALALAPLPVRVRVIDQRGDELALVAGGLVEPSLAEPSLAGCGRVIATTLTPLPEAEIRAASPGSAYVIVTHDHALDFLLAAEALARGDAAYVGMIGSRTKRATFLRHSQADPTRLTCPIAAGAPRDKRPEVIAAFAAAEIMAALLSPARLSPALPSPANVHV